MHNVGTICLSCNYTHICMHFFPSTYFSCFAGVELIPSSPPCEKNAQFFFIFLLEKEFSLLQSLFCYKKERQAKKLIIRANFVGLSVYLAWSRDRSKPLHWIILLLVANTLVISVIFLFYTPIIDLSPPGTFCTDSWCAC